MSWNEVAVVLGMALMTFPVRYVFFALGERAHFPPWIKRALRYVPVAVLTAITVPMVLLPGGQWQIDWRNAWLVGAIASGLIAWRFGHLLSAIGGGLVVYFAWRWLFGL